MLLAQSGAFATLWSAVAALAAAGSLVLLWRIRRSALDLVDVARQQVLLLAELEERSKRLQAERADIDARRTEHVLIDIRDGLKGLEDAVIQAASRPVVVERPAEPSGSHEVPAPDPADLVLERVQNRLAALGYDRVQIVGERELFEMAAVGRTEIPLEARRAGVLHKGRAVVEKGRIVDVRMDPPYALFP